MGLVVTRKFRNRAEVLLIVIPLFPVVPNQVLLVNTLNLRYAVEDALFTREPEDGVNLVKRDPVVTLILVFDVLDPNVGDLAANDLSNLPKSKIHLIGTN